MHIPLSPIVVGVLFGAAACGGGGGGAGGGGGPGPTPPTPPTPVTFTAGAVFPKPPSSFGTPPNTLLAIELTSLDDDAIPDLASIMATTFMATPTDDVNSMPGVGDGTFTGNYGGGGYTAIVTPLLRNGAVLGVGREGYVFAAENPAGTIVLSTTGYRTVGTSRNQVGGFGFAAGTLAGLAVGDLDGDAIDDVVVLDGTGRQALAFTSNGESGLDPGVPTALPAGATAPTGAAAADFGLNPTALGAREDVVVALGTEGYVVMTSTGTGAFTAGTKVPLGSGRAFAELVTGDFDGDGLMDVAGIVTQAGQPTRLGTLLGHGDGTFGVLLPSDLPASLGATALAQLHAGDFNGDGRTDVVLVAPALNRAAVFLTNSAGLFVESVDADLLSAGGVVSVHDVDGDGDLDVLIGNATTLDLFPLFNDRL